MNELTVLQNIQTKLQNQTWTGGGAVWNSNSVAIVPSITDTVQQALNTMVIPIALIEPGEAASDPEFNEEPDFQRFSPRVGIINAVPGDAVGQNVVVGGNKTGSITASSNRGILEYEQQLYNAVGKLNDLDSIQLQVRQMAEQGAAFKAPSMWIVYRIYQLEAWGTT